MLRPEERTKLDPTQDSDFYAFPRFVTHVDEGFIDRLTALYREILSPNTRILDLMSSWVSHLPEEMEFEHIEGHGMNGEELAKNPRLDSYFIQDLNAQPKLPLEDSSFDAVLITVSVQYLQYPEAIFAELYRILKPNGLVVVSFSNRMFYQKAIAAWRDNSDLGRVSLVKSYFKSVAGFREVQAIVRPATTPSFLQMLGIMVADPFYAVIGKRS
ncbi:MAG: class I SAM-dependent methyltransferase [Microcystis aeruginosa L211-101]|nr:class I SAM-dependent methyltransferase [Microcystis aeruginosa L211-11]NCR33265.1 class I SAM-dependent methyltransferase [Microcystis aeruginosa L211-101]